MPLDLLECPASLNGSPAAAGPAARPADRPAEQAAEFILEGYLVPAQPADPSFLAKILDLFRS